jgi:hypothetical protein
MGAIPLREVFCEFRIGEWLKDTGSMRCPGFRKHPIERISCRNGLSR